MLCKNRMWSFIALANPIWHIFRWKQYKDNVFNIINYNMAFFLLLGDQIWCRSRPLGGLNTPSPIWLWSDLELFTDGRRAKTLLLNVWDLKRWIYNHSPLSTWQQQWSMEGIYTAGCLYYCLPDLEGKLYFHSWMQRHREEKRRENRNGTGILFLLMF